MFQSNSFLNTVGEYAFACLSRSDMLLRPTMCNNTLLISTNYSNIVDTKDKRYINQSIDTLQQLIK